MSRMQAVRRWRKVTWKIKSGPYPGQLLLRRGSTTALLLPLRAGEAGRGGAGSRKRSASTSRTQCHAANGIQRTIDRGGVEQTQRVTASLRGELSVQLELSLAVLRIG